MFQYKIINKPKIETQKKTIDKIFLNIEKYVQIPQKWIINIIFLDNPGIQKLNYQYRQINATTDVLSFHYFTDFSYLKKNDTAWEIIFSEDRIKIQAIEYWLWEEKEFYKLLIHSILHILWYDHEEDSDYKIMQTLEDNIWNEVFEK
jgi:probable rRNA maturation factor